MGGSLAQLQQPDLEAVLALPHNTQQQRTAKGGAGGAAQGLGKEGAEAEEQEQEEQQEGGEGGAEAVADAEAIAESGRKARSGRPRRQARGRNAVAAGPAGPDEVGDEAGGSVAVPVSEAGRVEDEEGENQDPNMTRQSLGTAGGGAAGNKGRGRRGGRGGQQQQQPGG